MTVASRRALGRGHDAPAGHHGQPGDSHCVPAPRQPTAALDNPMRVAHSRLDNSRGHEGADPGVATSASCPHDHNPDYDDRDKERTPKTRTASLRSE